MYNFKTIKNAKGKTNHFFSTFLQQYHHHAVQAGIAVM